MTTRTVTITLRRKRTIYESQEVTVKVTDEEALAVRAYDGPPADHDFSFAASDNAKPDENAWHTEAAGYTEDLDPGISIEIDPSLEDDPPIIAKS
jgi:hypothetical protein